jgi:HK97 family phage major capsid protein
MKIKLLKDVEKENLKLVVDSILEMDEKSAQELIDAKSAQIYNEVEEQKEINKIVEEKVMTIEAKTVEVVKDEPTWKSAGEFLRAVMKAGRDGEIDRRLMKSTGQNETTPADGGYTVSTDIAAFITQQVQNESVIAGKCSQMEIGPLMTGIKIPQVNESARNQTTLYGGVRCYAPAEGVAKTAFKQAYTQKDIQLKKLCAVNYLTEELMQDNTSLESFIRMNVGKALAWTLDNDILNGTLSVCTAIKNHAACAEVTVAGDHATPAELTEMFTRNFNRTRAEWFMSADQYANIISLNTTGTQALFQPNYAVSPAGTLFGRPINVIEQAGVAGDETSLMFLDLKDYLVIRKGAIQEATSIHVKFLEDEVAFRWVMRVGGAPLLASAVTMPDGLVYSSLVSRD